MKFCIRSFLLVLFLLKSPKLQAQDLNDNEIKEAVSLTQLIINRATNDGSERPLFIMVGRGPAPIDTLLEYAGFDIDFIPLSIKNELQGQRLGKKENSIKKEVHEVFQKLFPLNKINNYDKIVIFDFWCFGDTLKFISEEFSNYLISIGKKDIAFNIMALTYKRPNISLILMHPDYKEILEHKSTLEVADYLQKELVNFLQKREHGLDSLLKPRKMTNAQSFSLLADPAFAQSMVDRKNVHYARFRSTILPLEKFTNPKQNESYLEKKSHILSKIDLIKELQGERGKEAEFRSLVNDDYRILDFWEYSRAIDAQKKLLESQNPIEETKVEAEIISETEESSLPAPDTKTFRPEKKSFCKKILSFFSVIRKSTPL